MQITPVQLLAVEKSIIEIYNQAKAKGSSNIIELKINDSVKVGYLPCSIEDAKLYLEKRFYNHPALKSKIVDDMFAYVTSSVSPQSDLSEDEHNQIAGIQEIVKRRGHSEGLKYVNAALIEIPSSIKLHLIKAEILSNINRLEEAIQVYDKVLKIEPSNAFVYADRGATKASLNRIAGAEKDYSLALKINNRLPVVLCNRGAMYIKLQRYNDSLQDYNNAISIDPSLARAYFERGTLKVAYLDDFENGMDDLMKAADLEHPGAIEALLGMGNNDDD